MEQGQQGSKSDAPLDRGLRKADEINRALKAGNRELTC